ncbi:MAG: nicotinate-nucleotide adenylyltransferase [Planctomycetota bacterium]|jgi:nicotinate-nucleotide adenylyltransferase
MAQRIGLLGGSFNPVHNGHLITARAAAEAGNLDRIVLLPSAHPPHKIVDTLSNADDRVAMLERATAGESFFEVSRFDVDREGPTYSIDTVAHFKSTLGDDVAVSWLIGADSLAELHTWHRVAELVALTTIFTMVRPGWEEIDWSPLTAAVGADHVQSLRAGILRTPAIDISSTQIRHRVATSQSVRYLVPDAVATYIAERGLYRRD